MRTGAPIIYLSILRYKDFHSTLALLGLGAALLLCPTPGQSQSESATTLLRAVARRMAGVDQSSFITLTQTDRRDSMRVRQFRLLVHYPQSSDSILKQSLVLVVQPEKSAGQKYWSWSMMDGRERRWIFLPGSRKLQEISHRSGRRNQDFDLSELEITAQQIEAHSHEVLDHPMLDGRETALIKSVEIGDQNRQPRGRQHKPSYKLLWIDPRSLLVRKAEFYSPHGRLLKRFLIEQTEVHGGLELATHIRIWDARQKKEAVLTIRDISLEPITDPGMFHPTAD